jgi:biopolymer transport protein TolR
VKAAENKGKYRIVAEINMIPFIDVVLVILIIFMVMTPFLIKAQIKVNLPPAGSTEKVDDQKSLTVQVDKAGDIFLEGQKVPPEGLAAELRQRIKSPQVQSMQIEADRDVAFEHVVTVLDAGKKAGVVKMGVSVKPVVQGR